jgi:epoxide hydrolase-like predicted phosphatase
MIKLIIFDLGGVLVENYDIPFFEALAKACNKEREVIEKEAATQMHQSERGEISEYEFVEEFLRKMHAKADAKEIIAIRRRATKEMQGTRELVENLKKYYKIAFATNNAQEEFRYNNSVMHFDKLFHWGIASCNAHARKTEPKMFEEILKHFEVKPEETIFIDDSVKNLVAPKKLGMQTIQFVSLEQVKKELKKEGIKF